MRTLITLVALSALIAGLPAQGSKAYKSKKHGFSLQPPMGFRQIPIKSGEKWILAKWQSKRPYFFSTLEGFTSEHKPMLRVLSFPKGLKRVETETRGSTTVKTLKERYRDYRDYLKRHHRGGGWFISKEKELTIKGVKATYMEVNIDKLSRTPKFYLVCVYHQDDRDLAVEIDVLKKHYPKMKAGYIRGLKSMKLFEAEVSAKDHNTRDDAPTVTTGEIKDWSKHLRDKRAAWKRKALEEAAKDLPPGWKKINTKNFLVLTHSSPRYTKHIIDFAKSMRKWLDKNFGKVGTGRISKSIIRICADSDEAMAYLQGSGSSFFSSSSGELVCSGGGQLSYDTSRVAHGIAVQYFTEKNPNLWQGLPDWMNQGLGNYISSAQLSKSKGFRFQPDTDARLRCRTMLKNKTFPDLQELLAKVPPPFGSDEAAWDKRRDYDAACVMFVRFLLEGPGKKGKSKQLLQNYLTKAVEILDQADEDDFKISITSKGSKQATTEEEEEEQWRKRREGSTDFSTQFSELEQRLLKTCHDHAFSGWGDKDWKKLGSAFRKYCSK